MVSGSGHGLPLPATIHRGGCACSAMLVRQVLQSSNASMLTCGTWFAVLTSDRCWLCARIEIT